MQTQDPVDEPAPSESRRGRRVAVITAAAVLAAALVAGSLVWWYDNSAAAAQAEATASASADAKKKADDLAAFLAKLAEDNRVSAAHAEARATQAAQAQAAADAKAEADRQTNVKSQMEAQGWHQFSGYLYFKYADNSKYTCSVLDCIYILVVSMAPIGCPGGFYVEASIERGSLSVGLANGVTAALPQGKAAAVRLEDVSGTGGGNTFRLSTLTCHGG